MKSKVSHEKQSGRKASFYAKRNRRHKKVRRSHSTTWCFRVVLQRLSISTQRSYTIPSTSWRAKKVAQCGRAVARVLDAFSFPLRHGCWCPATNKTWLQCFLQSVKTLLDDYAYSSQYCSLLRHGSRQDWLLGRCSLLNKKGHERVSVV